MKKFFTLTLALLASFSLWASTVDDLATISEDHNVYFEDIVTAKVSEGTLFDSNYLLSLAGGNSYATDKGTDKTVSKKYCLRVKSTTQDVIAFKVGSSCTLVMYANRITDRTPIVNTTISSTDPITGSNVTGTDGAKGHATYSIPAAGTYYIIGSGSDCYLAGLEFSGFTPVEPVCPSGLSISGTKAYTVGEKIELTAALEEGNGNITYQWYKGGKAEGNKLTGKTAAKLEIANCTGSDAGDYYCVASKADCADASNTEAYAVTVKTIEPTGDATITYVLDGSNVTGTVVGVNSISGLSTSFALSTLTIGNSKSGYSGAIKGTHEVTEMESDVYADIHFTLAEGYVFTPSAVSVKVNPLGNTGAVKAVVKVMDAQTEAASEILACAKNTDNAVQFAASAFTGKLFEGTIHLRMYFYGPTASKEFWVKSPITVEGTVSVAPTKYNVNFAAGEGTGTMSTLKYVAGAEVTLPECTFTAPEGKEFDAWTSSDVTISDNKFTMLAKDVTITATWKTAVTRYTVTYKDGESTLGTEEVEENGHPAEYAQYQNKSLYSFGGWYDNSGLTGDAIDLSAATITEDITYYANFEKVYATSINIEQIVLDEGTKYNLMGYMGTINYASNIENSLDTLNDLEDKTNRNYAYLGLKVKSAGKLLNFRLAEGKTVKVKFGAYPSDNNKKPQVSINGADYAAMTITDGVYSYTATGDDLISIKSATGDAVIFKQIMIDEEIKDVVLPAPSAYKITLNAGAHGTLAASWEGKTDKKVNVPVDATVTLTVTPESGYKIDKVTVDGETLKAVNDIYSFTMPAKAVTVAATFTEDSGSALDNTEDGVKAVKFFENGQLFIRRGDKIFDTKGQVVK